jgi:hypothetical protein
MHPPPPPPRGQVAPQSFEARPRVRCMPTNAPDTTSTHSPFTELHRLPSRRSRAPALTPPRRSTTVTGIMFRRPLALACAAALLLLALPVQPAAAKDLRAAIAQQLGQGQGSPMLAVLSICMRSPADCADLTVSALNAADAGTRSGCAITPKQVLKFKTLTRSKAAWEAFYKKVRAVQAAWENDLKDMHNPDHG